MSDISDEMLMAYADGALATADRQRVEAYLQSSSASVDRLRLFTSTGTELATLLDAAMREPLPPRLVQAILDAPTPSAKISQTRSRSVIAGLAALAAVIPSRQNAWAFASILLVGIGVGWALGSVYSPKSASAQLVVSSESGLRAGAGLQRVLSTVLTGSKEPIDGNAPGWSVKPSFTFESTDGNICRQYEVETPGEVYFSGLACRLTNGQWRIEAHTPIKPIRNANGTAYLPAGKITSPVVEGAVGKILKGDVFAPQEEKRLILDWSKTAK